MGRCQAKRAVRMKHRSQCAELAPAGLLRPMGYAVENCWTFRVGCPTTSSCLERGYRSRHL